MARKSAGTVPPGTIEFAPLTPERWGDFEKLFGARGACGGCWCMWPRVARAQFLARKGEGNKADMQALVKGGAIPGLLAYVDGEPAGWCAVAPRERYVRLARSRVMAPVDDEPVWSVVCFFITRAHRRRGLSVALLKAAVRHAGERGARIVEGYPEEHDTTQPDAFVYRGLVSAFRKAGFTEAIRRSPKRPIMRKVLKGRRAGNPGDG